MEIAETNRKAISCPCNQNRFNRILNTAAHSSEDSFLGTFPIWFSLMATIFPRIIPKSVIEPISSMLSGTVNRQFEKSHSNKSYIWVVVIS